MSFELLADVLARNGGMMQMTLADFSDQEMMTRPAPGANHPCWQLGHLIVAEANMVNAARPGTFELPAGFADKFNAKTAGVDDPKQLAGKQELLDLFSRVRAKTVEVAKALTPAEAAKDAPERIRMMAPTFGHVLHLVAQHTAMHVGQMQVARRKLGKKVLF